MNGANSPDDDSRRNAAQRVGLCVTCEFMRQVRSDRGSTFYLCERSLNDPRFAKYPRLPVLECPGYVPKKSG
jgi:hypothetical protein